MTEVRRVRRVGKVYILSDKLGKDRLRLRAVWSKRVDCKKLVIIQIKLVSF